MSLPTLSVTTPAAATYTERAASRYILSTSGFADAIDEFTSRQMKRSVIKNLPPGPVSVYLLQTGLSKKKEKSATVNGVTTPLLATASLSLNVPSVGFTTTDIDQMVTQISEALSTVVIDQLLMGNY